MNIFLQGVILGDAVVIAKTPYFLNRPLAVPFIQVWAT